MAPTRPLGFVAGQVHDHISEMPLEGVQVVVFGGGISSEVLTDAAGQFSIGPVAAGARFALSLTAVGYVSTDLRGLLIPAAAGNFPTDNAAVFVGPIGLVPDTGRFDVDVVDSSGSPVAGAEVVVETGPSSIGASSDLVRARAISDANGRASFSGLPDWWRVPFSSGRAFSYSVFVASVDADDDGRAELAGTASQLSAEDIRSGRRRLVVVMIAPEQNAQLQLLATNLVGVVDGRDGPSIVNPMDGVRFLFDQTIDLDTVRLSVVEERGPELVPSTVVAGSIDGGIAVLLTATPRTGQEYNLSLSVPDRSGRPPFVVRAPFFVEETPAQAVSVVGRFVDGDSSGSWGDGGDRLEFETTLPLGVRSERPYQAELWVELDLNGSGTAGDAPGELPLAASQYPTPIILTSAEPTPSNGAGASGFTRFLAPRTTRLSSPLADGTAVVNFELRFTAARNRGEDVTTPSGRAAPTTFTGSATLVSDN